MRSSGRHSRTWNATRRPSSSRSTKSFAPPTRARGAGAGALSRARRGGRRRVVAHSRSVRAPRPSRRARLPRTHGAGRRLGAAARRGRARAPRRARGRHPVVEALRPREPFVPNDAALGGDGEHLVVLTGPNMGGKSTYLGRTRFSSSSRTPAPSCPALSATVGLMRPHLHARRRLGFPRQGRIDVPRGDGRDRAHLEARDRAQPRHPRRDRARHVDVRRPFARVGDRRAPPRSGDPARACSRRITTS